MYTTGEVFTLLSHPDAQVRSHADWLREYRGEGWRALGGRKLTDWDAAQREAVALTNRLEWLRYSAARGIEE